ncbi:MAG: hypothetical protein Q9220_002184 [cf. Caloplaca sp. 1 TL-2023]
MFDDIGATAVVAEQASRSQVMRPDGSSICVPPQSPAFVLFTSGTTGQPKGVVQEHASVCTISKAYGKILHVDHNTRVLQFASYAFDVSTVDIFNTLIHGGCVCIPSEFQRKNEIVKVINDMRINWADITPSFSNTFEPEDVPSLRTLILAGEEVKKEHVERWANHVRLINCYGPSECGGCTAHEYLESGSPADTIGFPLPCFKFWVVAEDDVNRLVSIGAVGELLVEGPTLARGYLNDESRTREAFIESPVWLPTDTDETPRRFYRTKDLVQYRTDGSLRFVGRSDTQVKIRGQRVEFGEIEDQLTQYYGPARSMVAFPRMGQYANQLVAVVEVRSDSDVQDSAAVKAFLRRRLPNYMIPSVWLAVAKIPLSTSIKVDRRKVDQLLVGLRSDGTSASIMTLSQRLPLPPADALAHEIGIKVVEQLASKNGQKLTSLIGYDFGLAATGFDSILAISLRMWMKKQHGADVPVAKLISDTITISGLADLTRTPRKGVSTVELVQEVEALFLNLASQHTAPLTAGAKLSGRARRVFLTGATGYLGREILHQLINNPLFDKIYALVRCQSQSDSHTRLSDVVAIPNSGKLEAWPGDLQQIHLGLNDAHWNTLCTDVDVFIHNGAVVRWNAGFEDLKPANVLSTRELLRAMSKSRVPKSLVYVSGGQQLQPEEEDEATVLREVMASSGYAQTKLASEMLIKHAAGSELGAHHGFSIVKPSYIIGSAATGVANTTDYLWRLVAGAIEIGSYPSEGLDQMLYLSDVENVARVTIDAARSNLCKVHVIKILDGIILAEFWQCVGEAGYRMEAIDGDRWWRDMQKHILGCGEKHSLWPLMWMVEARQGFWRAKEGLTSCASWAGEVKDDGMRERVKAAVGRNLVWLRERKELVGF